MSKAAKKQNDRATRVFLWSHVKDQKKWLLPALGASVLFAFSRLGLSMVIKKFMDEAVVHPNSRRAFQLSLVFFILLVAEALLVFAQRFLTRIGTERAVRNLRNRVFSKFLTFSESTLSRYSSGMAVTRVVNDVLTIGVGIVQGSDILRAPFLIVGTIVYLFYLNWRITITCFILFPLMGFAGDRLGKSARRNQRRLQQSIEKISNHIVEALKGLRLAHVFEQTHLLRKEFEGKTTESYNHLIKLALIEESISPITKLLGAIVGTAVIAFAGWEVSRGHMTPGGFIAFITAAANLIDPFKVVSDFNVRYQQMAAASDRVREVLEEPLDPIGFSQESRLIDTGTGRLANRRERSHLKFENLSFRYPRRSYTRQAGPTPTAQLTIGEAERLDEIAPLALDRINLELEPGKRLALVGRSGSGKTTMSLLAMRLIDPSLGKVTLDGRDAREWNIAEYRSFFSYVSQDVFLFNRSIRENLLFARPGARDDEIWQALDKANIAEFVKGMPRQLDTTVAFDGADFSGGEKQRLSLARAFLRNSPILILDEATSQLDAFSEAAVQTALRQLVVDRSVIVIAHRLSTVKEMDQVAVFDQGQIVEIGAPQTLLSERSGPFFDLWSRQNSSLLVDT